MKHFRDDQIATAMNTGIPICEHLRFTRTELIGLIATKQLRNSEGILARYGSGTSCPTCREVIAQAMTDCRRRWTSIRRNRTQTSRRLMETMPAPAEECRRHEFWNLIASRYAAIRREYPIELIVTEGRGSTSTARYADIGIVISNQRCDQHCDLYLCGQNGNCSRPGSLLAGDLDLQTAIRYLDRFLIYYITTADPFTRTAPWCDMLEGGIDHIREVVVEDALGVCTELDELFQQLTNLRQRTSLLPSQSLSQTELVPSQGGTENERKCSPEMCPPHTEVFQPSLHGTASHVQTFIMKVEGEDVHSSSSQTHIADQGHPPQIVGCLADAGGSPCESIPLG